MRAGRNGDQPAQTVGGGAVELRTRRSPEASAAPRSTTRCCARTPPRSTRRFTHGATLSSKDPSLGPSHSFFA